jgi:hypothetical protein
MFMPGMLELLGAPLGWAGCVWLRATLDNMLDKKTAVTTTVIRFRMISPPH